MWGLDVLRLGGREGYRGDRKEELLWGRWYLTFLVFFSFGGGGGMVWLNSTYLFWFGARYPILINALPYKRFHQPYSQLRGLQASKSIARGIKMGLSARFFCFLHPDQMPRRAAYIKPRALMSLPQGWQPSPSSSTYSPDSHSRSSSGPDPPRPSASCVGRAGSTYLVRPQLHIVL